MSKSKNENPELTPSPLKQSIANPVARNVNSVLFDECMFELKERFNQYNYQYHNDTEDENWDDIKTNDSESDEPNDEFYDELDYYDCIHGLDMTYVERFIPYRLAPDGSGKFITEYEFMNFCVHIMGISWTNAGLMWNNATPLKSNDDSDDEIANDNSILRCIRFLFSEEPRINFRIRYPELTNPNIFDERMKTLNNNSAQDLLDKANECQCCVRHQTNRPTMIGNKPLLCFASNHSVAEREQFVAECDCTCRHTSRRVYRYICGAVFLDYI
jgi:hypothetical protein